ncbi:MAG: hypothetical protein WB543_19495 [Candidatus Acidiferrum sp.]
MTYLNKTISGFVLAFTLACSGSAQNTPPSEAKRSVEADSQALPLNVGWESPARLHHGLFGRTSGTLRADSRGIEFVPEKGATRRWAVNEIKSVDLGPHRLVLVGYDNRGWHLAGTQQFEWELTNAITPETATSLTKAMMRPVRNRLPEPDAPVVTVVAVRRSGHFGGSNGVLRFRQQGIDYITVQPGESRSWRWADLQTLSNPDPYHLFVFGYRDTYAFELKATLSREVLNHASDEIWAHNENAMRTSRGTPPLYPSTNGERKEDE